MTISAGKRWEDEFFLPSPPLASPPNPAPSPRSCTSLDCDLVSSRDAWSWTSPNIPLHTSLWCSSCHIILNRLNPLTSLFRSQRDGAIGFLSADSEYDTLGFRSIEALNRELEEAKQAAAEAEERAAVLRSSGSSPGGAEKVGNNGLSNMLTPIAVKMSQDKGNYLTGMRCPVREFQEALEVTKCGIMQYAGTLARDPATIGAVFIGMYLLTVACVSAPPSEPLSPF